MLADRPVCAKGKRVNRGRAIEGQVEKRISEKEEKNSDSKSRVLKVQERFSSQLQRTKWKGNIDCSFFRQYRN